MPGFCEACWFWSQWKHDVHSRGLGKDAIIQMVTKMLSEQRMSKSSFDVLRKIIMDSIDIVVHVGRDGVVRHMSDIYYKGAECENF